MVNKEAPGNERPEPFGGTAGSDEEARWTGDDAPREGAAHDHRTSRTPATSGSSVVTGPSHAADALPRPALEVHLQRVRDAYRESPNLGVTPSQAQRIFELEPRVCVAVLDALVNEAFLLRTREGVFVRRADHLEPPVPNSLFRRTPRPAIGER